MRQTIDGALFRRFVFNAAAVIEQNEQKINDLNVFPVPDGDTGTNMSMTLNTAAAELKRTDAPTLTKAADIAASAMLRGARGNSGVILSLLFRGIAKGLKGVEECGGTRFSAAMSEGVDAAYKAVMKPAEGTILTVSRIAAAAAENAAKENNFIEFVLNQSCDAAKQALAETMSQNPVLKKAGVVDAGGMGWLLILETALRTMRGEEISSGESAEAVSKERADFSEIADEDITFSYCTEFIVSRETCEAPDSLREYLSGMGDCLVQVEDEDIIKVHVHTNNPGEVLEKALTYGALQTVKVENMRLQHTGKVMSDAELSPAALPEKPYGMVAVCAGEGLVSLFRDLGVDGIVPGGQTMNPSTQDILKVVNRTPAETVFVFPNNKNIIMAAEQAVPLTEKNLVVVPSKTVPQGISAVLAFNPDADAETNKSAMLEMMKGVSTMQITYAARNSDYDGYEIHEGDYLALWDGALFGTGRDMNTLLKALAEKSAKEGKCIVTIFYGEGVEERKAKKALSIFEKCCPEADVSLVAGKQPVYYFLISAE